jgi:hypothetical protein
MDGKDLKNEVTAWQKPREKKGFRDLNPPQHPKAPGKMKRTPEPEGNSTGVTNNKSCMGERGGKRRRAASLRPPTKG